MSRVAGPTPEACEHVHHPGQAPASKSNNVKPKSSAGVYQAARQATAQGKVVHKESVERTCMLHPATLGPPLPRLNCPQACTALGDYSRSPEVSAASTADCSLEPGRYSPQAVLSAAVGRAVAAAAAARGPPLPAAQSRVEPFQCLLCCSLRRLPFAPAARRPPVPALAAAAS